MSEEKQGSFLNGFTIGLFAGAAGYFLFGTDKGISVRKKLAVEWERAKKDLEKEGVLKEGEGLREIVADTVKKIAATSKTQNKVKSPKAKTKQTNKKKKFKGV